MSTSTLETLPFGDEDPYLESDIFDIEPSSALPTELAEWEKELLGINDACADGPAALAYDALGHLCNRMLDGSLEPVAIWLPKAPRSRGKHKRNGEPNVVTEYCGYYETTYKYKSFKTRLSEAIQGHLGLSADQITELEVLISTLNNLEDAIKEYDKQRRSNRAKLYKQLEALQTDIHTYEETRSRRDPNSQEYIFATTRLQRITLQVDHLRQQFEKTRYEVDGEQKERIKRADQVYARIVDLIGEPITTRLDTNGHRKFVMVDHASSGDGIAYEPRRRYQEDPKELINKLQKKSGYRLEDEEGEDSTEEYTPNIQGLGASEQLDDISNPQHPFSNPVLETPEIRNEYTDKHKSQRLFINRYGEQAYDDMLNIGIDPFDYYDSDKDELDLEKIKKEITLKLAQQREATMIEFSGFNGLRGSDDTSPFGFSPKPDLDEEVSNRPDWISGFHIA